MHTTPVRCSGTIGSALKATSPGFVSDGTTMDCAINETIDKLSFLAATR